MFDVLKDGFFEEVTLPEFGRQDVGVSPGGVMDRFSFEAGNSLLGNPPDAPALEIIVAPTLKFRRTGFFILTGAKHDTVVLKNQEMTPIEHGVVYKASEGSVLEFGPKRYGFRAYLCFLPEDGGRDKSPEGRKRGVFNDIASWCDPSGRIRIMEGPEYQYLDNPRKFLETPWKISTDTGKMGMRLDSCTGIKLSLSMEASMVSGAVSDGTVQLTPNGPIVLLKHRQTIGGYPRIFNVVSVDVDLLAQYFPGQIVRFRKVSSKDALQAMKTRHKYLEDIRQRYR